MAAPEMRPEIEAAIRKAVIVDAVMLGVGAVLWFVTEEIAWFVVCFIVGSATFPLLLAQAGAFTRKDERR